MKKIAYNVILAIILSVAVATVSVLTSISICSVCDGQYYKIAIFVFIGLIGGYFMHNILHEAGHALFAERAGATIFEVAFCGFVFARDKKVGMNLRSGVAGWTEFVPNEPKKASEVLRKSLVGGMIGSFLSLFIAVIVYCLGIFTKNYFLASAFGAHGAVNVYMIMLNFFSSARGTDGRLMASAPEEYALAASFLEYQSYLYNGVSAKNIERLDFDNPCGKKITTLFDVQKALQTGDAKTAEVYLDVALSEHKTTDNGLIALYLEKLFVSILFNDKENTEKYFLLSKKEIEYPSTVTSLRVACYYRKYDGEEKWADSLKTTFYRSLNNCALKGQAETEREIFENYSYFLMNEN